MSERSLASAVILRAIEDLKLPDPAYPRRQNKTAMKFYAVNLAEAQTARKEARLFLSSDNPEWKRSREYWCSLAEISPRLLTENYGEAA